MHMADALLSPAVGITMDIVSIGAIAYSMIGKNKITEQRIPMMGVMGAFVFAAQMINFSIPGTGSSGHIGGGILLAALLGGGPALLTLTAVLLIQCFFFADGGLLALGCNIFNMGVCTCLVGYPLIFRPLCKGRLSPGRLSIACILSVIVSLQLGSLGVVLETVFSGTTQLPFSAFFLLMQPIHLAIGLGEGLVTAAVLCFVLRTRPELLEVSSSSARPAFSKRAAALFLAAALVVGGGLSYIASSHPDGLEWSIEKITGTADLQRNGDAHQTAAELQDKTALMPDYALGEKEHTTGLAGITGGIMTLGLAALLGGGITLLKRRKQ